MRARLVARGAPAWDALVRIEMQLGGLRGADPRDERELWVQIEHGAARLLDGEPHVVVGGYSPILWLVRESGRVVELDELGERFYESDSLVHRLEQLALFDSGVPARRYEGARGEALAARLGLAPIPEASDSMQRYWGTGGSRFETSEGVQVSECLTPSDYGARDRVWSTWISCAREEALEDAVARVGE